MLTYNKDDFDENFDDILNSINGILKKKKETCDEHKEDEKENYKNI